MGKPSRFCCAAWVRPRWRRQLALPAVAAAALLCACSAPQGAAPLYVGRFMPAEGHPQAGAVRFAWSGSTMVARFSGSHTLALRLRDRGAARPEWHNVYSVQLDAGQPQLLTIKPGQDVYPVQSGLSLGPHTLRIVKRTEASLGEGLFSGLQLDPGATLLPPPPPRARQIDLIGDSISAGYGNTGAGPDCSFAPESENVLEAYGPLAAAALDAEATVLAYSGRGVFRNAAASDGPTLPEMVDRVLPHAPQSVWPYRTRLADAVVINLGTNDFYRGIPDAAGFVRAYTGLIAQLRQHNPHAYLLCCLGPMLANNAPRGEFKLSVARALIHEVVRTAQRGGDRRIGFLEFPVQSAALGYGCDYHPSRATHAQMATQLSAALRTALQW